MQFSSTNTTPLLPPNELHKQIPLTTDDEHFIAKSRNTIANILWEKDPRFLLIVGPCSVHDTTAAVSYARKLQSLAKKVSSTLFIVMRVYFEKPRTRLGWKGLLHDPNICGTQNIREGLIQSRQLLKDIAALKIPAACEFLDPMIPPYLADCISWGAIGARTTMSQTHRQLASGLPMPIGFKNQIDGDIKSAIDAVIAASSSHSYLGLTNDGKAAVVQTTGNPHTHVVLRGGTEKPNYHASTVTKVLESLQIAGLSKRIIIDCSHDNSRKKHDEQLIVFRSILEQKLAGEKSIQGAILESYHDSGKQNLHGKDTAIAPSQSLTDPCLDWENTEELILYAHRQLQSKKLTAHSAEMAMI